jgi:hypothetical protein
MTNHIVLAKHKYDGNCEDITWKKAQIFRNHGNLRGYRIDFVGVSKLEAFAIIEKMSANAKKSAEEDFLEKNRPF